ncbi:Eukaryotic translation initiation factor 5 [Dichanthelium oligosanthes]|uniref:Eukaryotic translation initiation factor 5 n=1 Tax=Dichanthelium oligosanthes TaxID=888268 RepID=A0A1E5VY58_9POAL|nr:Eukaryotic translation initiation factor 5 [Dichanthelium oligosanthes]
MALQNIGASNKDDAFYRYKMPSMITKTEGRGNGIRTKIENIADIAKALDRPASYITKYFGYELGADNKFDEQRTSLINGAHDTVKLAGLLDNFIKKYVQCYGCGNPETKILISKTQMVSLKCAACGFVSGVKTGCKLTKFILKNASEQKGGKGKKAMQRADNKCLKEGKAADENQKKLNKDTTKKKGVSSKEFTAKGGTAKNNAAVGLSDEDHSILPSCCRDGGNVGAADEDGDDDEVQWQTDTSLEAMKQRMQEQLSTVTAELVTLSTDESEKKKESSHNDIAVYGSANPRDNYDNKQTIGKANPYNELVEEIKANLGNAITAAQLKKVISSSTLASQDVMNALFEALFDRVGKGFKEEVVKNKEYLAAAVPDEGSQTLLLLAIEVFGSKCSALALKEIPFVLRALYCADVLEEETIIHWYNVAVASGKNSKVLQNAKPFVECLQSANYESEEE